MRFTIFQFIDKVVRLLSLDFFTPSKKRVIIDEDSLWKQFQGQKYGLKLEKQKATADCRLARNLTQNI